MVAADQLREPPMRARRLQGTDEGRRRDPLRHHAPSVRGHASVNPRRPDESRTPPRSARAELGQVRQSGHFNYTNRIRTIMEISGDLLIGKHTVRGTNGSIKGIDAATGEALAPAFGGATLEQLEQACALAGQASDIYRELPLETRAKFLETIAQNILDIGDVLIERCVTESGLPRGRIEGERGRTVGQLRMFAAVVREGDFLGVRIDPAQPQRQPLPRVDLRLRYVPLGPLAGFGASNFPLAFSVAGGDTAPALAPGFPVIAKAHSAHPGTSALVGRG